MGAFTEHIEISADIVGIWETLAAIGDIAEWNPGVRASRLTGDLPGGVGASRHCDLVDGHFVREEVLEWEPLKRLTLRVTQTDLPMKSVDIQFTLRDNNGSTTVRVRPDYELRNGIFGSLLDFLFVRRQYVRGMRALLRGLKKHCEAG